MSNPSILSSVIAVLSVAIAGSALLLYAGTLAAQKHRRLRGQITHLRYFNDAAEALADDPDTPEGILKYLRALCFAINDPTFIADMERDVFSGELTDEEREAVAAKRRMVAEIEAVRPDLAKHMRLAIGAAIAYLVCRSDRISEAIPELTEQLTVDPDEAVARTVVRVRNGQRANKGKNGENGLAPAYG